MAFERWKTEQVGRQILSFLCLITPLCSYLYGGLYGGLYERADIIRYFPFLGQTTWLKASVCRYLSTQRTLEHAVGAMCLRRTGSLLAEVVFSWRALALKHRPTRTRRMQKAAAVRAMRAMRVTRKIMLAWRAASTGKFSRKEIKRSYERRKRQAEIRAMDKAEAVGYEPALVTEEMIMEEMNAEAEEQIKSRHLKIQMGERVHTWREGHKSKVGARHRAARLLKEMLAA